ncbi:MAG: dTDP-4-dehydrorhamnose reductase [Hyphomonadaceae bacterium]|nr:dTDP-4-dehydrorhamnose reductase [Hyphomonadaceae bacterium]
MIPLRIACIGKHGQTAQALAAVAAGYASIELHQAGRDGADLTDATALEAFIHQSRAHVVINAGAYNLVDKAESDEATAFAVNAEGPRVLARLCRRHGVKLIHMSTDCVFDGVGSEPHREDETPRPLSAYGRSKLAGEMAVAEEYPDAVTARVCWVFSEFAGSFVSKVIEWARARPVLQIVSDQIGPPTYAPDIAIALLRLARTKVEGVRDLSGLLHLASPDVMSRSDMATAIMAESKRQGGPFAEIEPVSTASFNAPAKRPLNARLSGVKATAALGLSWTPFDEALERSVAGVLRRTET